MIEIGKGSIFDYSVDALVNPVNCVGVAGAGLAKKFREKYPENQKQYVWECHQGIMRPGHLGITHVGIGLPKYIINFPTKIDWREDAKIKHIEAGLEVLERAISWFDIISIAIPALGCGLGGLSWLGVKPLIEETARNINSHQIHKQTEFFLFEPK